MQPSRQALTPCLAFVRPIHTPVKIRMPQISHQNLQTLLKQVKWNDAGLVAAIAQDHQSQEILMLAWMNDASLQLTIETGHAVYWSRSRQKLWHKGESSGHQQVIHDIRLDCDGDSILLQVEQVGSIACHTGRRSCFYRTLGDKGWEENAPVIKDPNDIYHLPSKD